MLDSFSNERSLIFDGTVTSTIKALRTDRTEAIFITAPKYLEKGAQNICGQAFLITMIRYLKSNFLLFNFLIILEMAFFSRDIVFLFPDNHDNMNLLLKNIIETSSKNYPIIGIPSNILASINVEIAGDACNSLNSFLFKYEGENTLPYIDLLNTITKIADFHGLDARFDAPSEKGDILLPSIAQSLLRQYSGHLDSGHNYFLKYKL